MTHNIRYGTCVDVDECSARSETCDAESETCVNLPGRYKCICRWGFMWSADQRICVPDAAVKRAEIRLVTGTLSSVRYRGGQGVYPNRDLLFLTYSPRIHKQTLYCSMWGFFFTTDSSFYSRICCGHIIMYVVLCAHRTANGDDIFSS